MMYVKQQKVWRMSCNVDEVMERLENEVHVLHFQSLKVSTLLLICHLHEQPLVILKLRFAYGDHRRAISAGEDAIHVNECTWFPYGDRRRR